MAQKKYKRIFSICKCGGKPEISSHLVIETKKTYYDITSQFIREKRNVSEGGEKIYNGYIHYIGYRLLKKNEYKIHQDKYWILMFGSNLEKLKQAWTEALTPTFEDEDDFKFNAGTLNHYAKMLTEERIEL